MFNFSIQTKIVTAVCLFIVVIIMLSVSVIFVAYDNETRPEPVDKFRSEYQQVTDEEHVFEYVSANQILYMIENKKTALIVLGFKECPWCQALMPVLNEAAKNEALEKVYYLDIKTMRDDTTTSEHKKYLMLKEAFSEAVDESKDRLNAPTVIFLKDGELVDYHIDTVITHVMNDNNVLPPLTKDEHKELLEILESKIDKIK